MVAPESPQPSLNVNVAATAAGGFQYPDRFTEALLIPQLAARLAGRPANGVTPKSPATIPGTAAQVVWVDAGSDVLVHLDSIKVQLADGSLAVSVDLECDQTGRSALVVVFALGKPGDLAGLLAVTDDLPRGNGILAARWGTILQASVWAALLSLLGDYAAERHATPAGFAAGSGALALLADASPAILTTGALK